METENINVLRQFTLKPRVKILDATIETAAVFGDVKNNLKKAGTPIPINDVWIAAHAMEVGAIMITYDRHFRHVPGLRLWSRL